MKKLLEDWLVDVRQRHHDGVITQEEISELIDIVTMLASANYQERCASLPLPANVPEALRVIRLMQSVINRYTMTFCRQHAELAELAEARSTLESERAANEYLTNTIQELERLVGMP